MNVDPFVAAGGTAAGAVGSALVIQLFARWRSRREQIAADQSASAETRKADADLVSSLGAAFEKLTNQLQEELDGLRNERAAWSAERHELRNEVTKLRSLVTRMTRQLKAAGLEPILEEA